MLRKLSFGLAIALALATGTVRGIAPAHAQVDYSSMSQQQLVDMIMAACGDGGDDCTALIRGIMAAAALQPAVMGTLAGAVAIAVNRLETTNPVAAGLVQDTMQEAPSEMQAAFENSLGEQASDLNSGVGQAASDQ